MTIIAKGSSNGTSNLDENVLNELQDLIESPRENDHTYINEHLRGFLIKAAFRNSSIRFRCIQLITLLGPCSFNEFKHLAQIASSSWPSVVLLTQCIGDQIRNVILLIQLCLAGDTPNVLFQVMEEVLIKRCTQLRPTDLTLLCHKLVSVGITDIAQNGDLVRYFNVFQRVAYHIKVTDAQYADQSSAWQSVQSFLIEHHVTTTITVETFKSLLTLALLPEHAEFLMSYMYLRLCILSAEQQGEILRGCATLLRNLGVKTTESQQRWVQPLYCLQRLVPETPILFALPPCDTMPLHTQMMGTCAQSLCFRTQKQKTEYAIHLLLGNIWFQPDSMEIRMMYHAATAQRAFAIVLALEIRYIENAFLGNDNDNDFFYQTRAEIIDYNGKLTQTWASRLDQVLVVGVMSYKRQIEPLSAILDDEIFAKIEPQKKIALYMLSAGICAPCNKSMLVDSLTKGSPIEALAASISVRFSSQDTTLAYLGLTVNPCIAPSLSDSSLDGWHQFTSRGDCNSMFHFGLSKSYALVTLYILQLCNVD